MENGVILGAPRSGRSGEHRSAGFEPAVSPVSNRRGSRRSPAYTRAGDRASADSKSAIQQDKILRYEVLGRDSAAPDA